MNRALLLLAVALLFCHGCASKRAMDKTLQTQIESLDVELRNRYGMQAEQSSIAFYDLKRNQSAGVREQHLEYAASVAKIGILIAYFDLHPQAATNLDAQTKRELGLMIKASSNEMASKFSEQMGLRQIQDVLNRRGFYDAARGGGIWVGKHYGKTGERIGDPIGNNSHAATAEQILRFYRKMEQGRLLSRDASARMREIFASPEIPHDQIKFVKGLAGRDVTILRKWGSWENWLHDSAIIEGPNRKFILVALTHHPRGDEYLEELARRVDDLMTTR